MLVEPRFRSKPLGAVSNAADEAIALAASAGLVMDPWQEAELRNALGERADGSWAASTVGIVVPRQNGKGVILEARVLAGLFLFDERLIIWSAHEFKTSQEAYRRLLHHIESTPHLDALVKRKLNNTTETSIELHSGQRVRFVARSTGSGRGLSGDVVILDEAYKLPSEVMAALIPTMSARPNRQLWYTSSAPLPGRDSDTLRRVCRRGRQGEDRLAFGEYCAHVDLETPADLPKVRLTDVDLWREANPGMDGPTDHAITAEAISTESDELAPEDFARERLGIWFDEPDSADHVIDLADWADCALKGKWNPVGDLALALDVHHGTTSIAISDGRHVELIDHRPRTTWVVQRLAQLIERWKPVAVVMDPKGNAGNILDDLLAAGIEPHLVSGVEFVHATGRFIDDVEDHKIRHFPSAPLDTAVGNAVRRQYGDSWAWSRSKSPVDIGPLVAVSLARWAINHGEEDDGPSVYEDRGMVSL